MSREPIPIDPATVQVVLRLAVDRLSPAGIAERTGLHLRQVKRVLDEHRIEPSARRMSLEQQIVRMGREKPIDDVCKHFDVSYAVARKILARHGIEPIRKQYAWKGEPNRNDPWKNRRGTNPPMTSNEDKHYPPPPQKTDPTRAAKEAFIDAYLLGGKPARLVITQDGFFLDGKPIGYNALIRKTNEMRLRWGQEQVTGNPAWVLEETA